MIEKVLDRARIGKNDHTCGPASYGKCQQLAHPYNYKCCEKVFLTFTRVFQIGYIPCCNQMFPLTLVCMVETVELPVFVPLSVFVPLPVQGGWVPVLRPGGSKIFS